MSALERYYRARYERFRMLLKWREQIPRLLKAVAEVLPDAEVYLFGSALRNSLTADSDVDVLIVSDRVQGKRHNSIAAEITEEVGEPFIFEIHLVNKDKLAWYRTHAKELVPVAKVGKA